MRLRADKCLKTAQISLLNTAQQAHRAEMAIRVSPKAKNADIVRKAVKMRNDLRQVAGAVEDGNLADAEARMRKLNGNARDLERLAPMPAVQKLVKACRQAATAVTMARNAQTTA